MVRNDWLLLCPEDGTATQDVAVVALLAEQCLILATTIASIYIIYLLVLRYLFWRYFVQNRDIVSVSPSLAFIEMF